MAVSGQVRARLFGPPGNVDRVIYTTPWGIKVSIHPQILARFKAACELAHRTGEWTPQRIDSYNPRPIRGTDGSDLDEWSLHAWALAFDFFATPPNVPPPGGVWTPYDEMTPAFVAAFTRYGFRWGGTFKRRDTPHIEWADGIPAPLAGPGDTAPTEDDMPLTDDDKKWIHDEMVSVIVGLGVAGAADPRNPATTAIVGEVRKVPGWVAENETPDTPGGPTAAEFIDELVERLKD